MKKLLLYFTFCIGLTINAQEQNLNYNNEPLEEVIKDIENRFQVRFSFNTKTLQNQFITHSEAITLQAFFDVIETQTQIKIQQIDTDNFVITKSDIDNSIQDLNVLEEVVVISEYLTLGFDLNKKTGAIIVNPNKLSVLPGLLEPDVLQSLQSLPGITSPTESASRLHIRGGTPDQNLILFDGITMYHGGHLFGMISPFNPFVIDKVEVFRSGASAEYGKRIAGVVDIKTYSDIPEKVTGSLGSTTLQSNINIKAPIIKDTLGIIVAGRRALTDIWNSFTYKSYSDKVFQNTKIEEINNIQTEEELTILDNTFKFSDMFAKVIYKPSKRHTITASSIFVNNDLNHANQDVDQEGSSDNLQLTNNGFSLNWTGNYNNNWSTLAKLYYSEYNSKYAFSELTVNTSSPDQYARSNTINDFGFLATIYYKPSQRHNLSVGHDFSNYDVVLNVNETFDNETFNENISAKQNRHTIFSQYTYNTEKWYLRTGFRTNYFSDLDLVNLEPRLYSDYKLSDDFKVKLSAEKRYQIISQLVNLDNNDLGLGNELWALTNDVIPILSNTQFTTGFLFNRNDWKIDVEGYYKYIKGLSSITRGFNTNTTANIDNFTTGNNTIYGADVLVKKRIKWLSFWLGYSLSKSELEFPEIQDKTFPSNFDQSHVLSLSSTLNYKRFQASLGWQYATGIPFTEALAVEEFVDDDDETAFRINYNTQNGARLPNYYRFDASIVYNFYFGEKRRVKARIGASLINVFNKQNEIDRLFSLSDDDTNAELAQQKNIGLRYTGNLVFRLSF